MRRKTGYKILLAAMMALAIANVYVGKALDVHANDPLSRAECAASGSDATVERVLPDLPFPPGGLHRSGVLPADARHPLRRTSLPMLSRRRLFARPPRVRPARTSRRGLTFRRRMYASGPYNRSRDRYPDIPYPLNPSHEIIYSAAGPAARRLYGICRLHCQKRRPKPS